MDNKSPVGLLCDILAFPFREQAANFVEVETGNSKMKERIYGKQGQSG